jgi:hypothetical protein
MRKVLTLAAVAAAAIGGSAAIAAPAVAEEPWGFEQVTPPNKGDAVVAGADTFRTSQDGNLVHYTMTASMASVPSESSPMYVRYLGMRGSDRWTSRPIDPLFGAIDDVFSLTIMLTGGISDNQQYAFVATMRALAPGAVDGDSNLYLRNTQTGTYRFVATSPNRELLRQYRIAFGMNLNIKYVANDGRSALFTAVGMTDDLEPWLTYLYRWTEQSGIEVVSVRPESEGGGPFGGSPGGDSETTTRNGVPSGDWTMERIYFQGSSDWNLGPAYVRAGGRTRAVSVPLLGDPDAAPLPARIDAFTKDGRYAVISSTERLTEDSTSGYMKMYRYDFEATRPEDRLVFLGGGGPSARIYQMTDDGQTIAFSSTEVLTADAVDGNDNNYVWRNGRARLVATFPSVGGLNLNLLSTDGRYWSITTSMPEVAAEFDYDNRSLACSDGTEPRQCPVAYRYDTVADRLECVSCRSDGLPTRGPAGLSQVAQGPNRFDRRQEQTIAEDGTVFFTSSDDLLPQQDRNGDIDVYAWRDGTLRLLSRGLPGTQSRFLDASLDGRVVVMATTDPISPTDVDKVEDIYVTRAGAGYPYTPPVEERPCTGADCRGSLTPPAPAPIVGTVSLAGDGNAADEPARPGSRAGGGRVSATKLKAVRGSVAKLRVKLPAAGRLTVSGRGVVRVSKRAVKATTRTVRVALDARARRALRRSRTRRQKVKLTFAPVTGSTTRVSLTITYKAPAPSKKGHRR